MSLFWCGNVQHIMYEPISVSASAQWGAFGGYSPNARYVLILHISHACTLTEHDILTNTV